jgi:TatA/E family protein of Tat protein translocase
VDILGVGPLELILILVVALLVFGPDRLPEMGAKLGKGMRGMRRATREFSREIEAARAAIEAPLDEIKAPLKEIVEPIEQASDAAKKVTGAVQAARHPGRALQQSIKRELTEATEDIDLEAAMGSDAVQTDKKKEQDTPTPAADSVPKPDPATKTAVLAAQATRKRGLAIEEALKRELAAPVAPPEEELDVETAGKPDGENVADEDATETAAPLQESAPRISPFDDADAASAQETDQSRAESSEADAPTNQHPEPPAEEA